MPDHQRDAPGRLQDAALELFETQGFEATTVAQIAERAGLTQRTFFRYFADKREALFWEAQGMYEAVGWAISSAAPSVDAFDAVAGALTSVAVSVERQPTVARRLRVATRTPELRERQLVKLESLAAAVARAVGERGADQRAAAVAGQSAVAVMRVAFDRWAAGDAETALSEIVQQSVEHLRSFAQRHG